MTEPTSASPPAFLDRKPGLVLFGIFELLIAGFCFLMIPLVIIGSIVARSAHVAGVPAMTTGMIASSIGVYLCLAVMFAWLGIGSVMARRWARSLTLVIAWFWLVSGIGSLAMVAIIMPDLSIPMPQGQSVPPGLMRTMHLVVMAFSTVIYIVIPGALVLFYRSRHVKATCEARDPVERWTDRCPLPVLALTLVTGLAAFCMPLMGCYNWVFPTFGTILTGLPGAAYILPLAVIFAFISWGMYRLTPAAWWAFLILVLLMAPSAAITFSRVSLIVLYERMGFPKEMIAMMRPCIENHGVLFASYGAAWCVAILAYLAWIRKYFACAHDPSNS